MKVWAIVFNPDDEMEVISAKQLFSAGDEVSDADVETIDFPEAEKADLVGDPKRVQLDDDTLLLVGYSRPRSGAPQEDQTDASQAVTVAGFGGARQDIDRIADALEDVATFGAPDPHRAGLRPAGSVGTAVSGDLDTAVETALRRALNWRGADDDVEGFRKALHASFVEVEHDGRTDYEWREGAYATVSPESGGGPSGPQASLLIRASSVQPRVRSTLEHLQPLLVEADPQRTAAHKALIRHEFDAVVEELRRIDGPRVGRLEQLWTTLVGDETGANRDPDVVGGLVGDLRDGLGLHLGSKSAAGSGSATGPHMNGVPRNLADTAEEDAVLTAFRTLVDDLLDQRASFEAYRKLLSKAGTSGLLGAQLVALERALAVVGETVLHVEAAFDRAGIGPAERQVRVLPLRLGTVNDRDETITIEGLLDWVRRFATVDGPILIREGGRIGIEEVIVHEVQRLEELTKAAVSLDLAGTSTRRERRTSPQIVQAMRRLHEDLIRVRDLVGRDGFAS